MATADGPEMIALRDMFSAAYPLGVTDDGDLDAHLCFHGRHYLTGGNPFADEFAGRFG